MGLPARSWMVLSLLATGLVGGCADVPPSAPSPVIPVGCVTSIGGTQEDVYFLPWELAVETTSIKGGQVFVATFDGTAVFPDSYVVEGLAFFPPGGVTEINAVEIKATVRVRRGATQTSPDVVLLLDEAKYPYRCRSDRRPCDPDQDDPLSGVPGRRSNSECQPGGPDNPCGRFIPLPISTDCDSGGFCDALGKTGQCNRIGACITEDDFRLELRAEDDAVGRYVADDQGHVLFGFDDTHVALREGGVNDRTQIIPTPVYENPTGPVGIRATLLNLPVAWECAMGIDCHDPIFGSGCRDLLSIRAPDERLISFPIQTEAP